MKRFGPMHRDLKAELGCLCVIRKERHDPLYYEYRYL